MERSLKPYKRIASRPSNINQTLRIHVWCFASNFNFHFDAKQKKSDNKNIPGVLPLITTFISDAKQENLNTIENEILEAKNIVKY